MLPFLRSQTKHWLVHKKHVPSVLSPQLNGNSKSFCAIWNNKSWQRQQGNRSFLQIDLHVLHLLCCCSQTVFLLTVENSLEHGPSVEVIIVSVWWWGPPVCQAWTYSTGDNSTATRRQINCLTPAATHFIPPARLLLGNLQKKHSLKTSYQRHQSRGARHWIFSVHLFCLWRGPLCLWLWGANEIKASSSADIWVYHRYQNIKTYKPGASTNRHRSCLRRNTSCFCHGNNPFCRSHFGCLWGSLEAPT